MKPVEWFINRIKNLSARDILMIALVFSVALIAVVMFFVFLGSEPATADDPCLACHGEGGVMPGIYADWNSSVHAANGI